MSGELRFMSELTAVLGNLTRYQDVQQLACQCKGNSVCCKDLNPFAMYRNQNF